MKERVVAKRYGRALFALARERETLEGIETDMASLRSVVDRVPVLVPALSDERIAVGRRQRAAEDVARVLKLCQEVTWLLALLIAKRRIALLPIIVEDVQQRLQWYRRQATATAWVADAKGIPELCRSVERMLHDVLGVSGTCRAELEPELYGGFVLRVGDERYDASLRGKLERMKEEL